MQRLLIIFPLLLGAFLLFFRLNTLMPFIGDQAWFYLSARDMLLTHTLPLVGITSSHTWLHQGPLWTYLLAGIFSITNFNPLAPGYFSGLITFLTIYIMYKIGKAMFSPRVGTIASILFASSPLVILNGRIPFCTVPIPLVVLLFIFALYKFVHKSRRAFPLCVFLLAVLYNLEIATSIFVVIFLLFILWGIFKRTDWIKQVYSLKIILISLFAGVIPMIPMIIYDTTHGYPQTIKFAGWFVLHIINIIIPIKKLAEPTGTISQMFPFVGNSLAKIIFIPNELIAISLFTFATIYVIFMIYQEFKNIKQNLSFLIIFLTTFIPFLALIGSKTPSDAYLPMLFPGIIFILSIFFEKVYTINKVINAISVLLISFIVIFNSYELFAHNYYMQQTMGYGLSFATRQKAAEEIIKIAQNKLFVLQGIGPGSEFSNFPLDFTYLTWYQTRFVNHQKNSQIIYVYDDGQKYKVTKNRLLQQK